MTCDICKRTLDKYYIDGATKQGPWGNLCRSCHKAHGVGFGLGQGQLFERQSDGTWKKTKG